MLQSRQYGRPASLALNKENHSQVDNVTFKHAKPPIATLTTTLHHRSSLPLADSLKQQYTKSIISNYGQQILIPLR